MSTVNTGPSPVGEEAVTRMVAAEMTEDCACATQNTIKSKPRIVPFVVVTSGLPLKLKTRLSLFLICLTQISILMQQTAEYK
jgi:hypothetical protein